MTIHELMYGLHYTPVLTALLILITLQMILIFASFSAGRSGKSVFSLPATGRPSDDFGKSARCRFSSATESGSS